MGIKLTLNSSVFFPYCLCENDWKIIKLCFSCDDDDDGDGLAVVRRLLSMLYLSNIMFRKR